jgi:NagD protein
VSDSKPVEAWMTDMDGVLVHEGSIIPGADAFVKRLRAKGVPFLVHQQLRLHPA